ncbi:MAG TPA: MFS transporter [Kofleriaceae bacterium]|nr:MFS transporter [Kofleriaceae bacterium]
MSAADPTTDAAVSRHRFAVLATVLPAAFMQLVDVSIVNVAIPSIQRQLHASYGVIELVVAGYQLAFACTLITGARLGDLFGRKRLFVVGMVAFTVASMLCGAAPTSWLLVVARVLQGVASGLMYPQVLSVIQVTFPPAERGRAFGIYGATIGLATILGPLLGGLLIFLDLGGLDWRLVFFVNVPIGIAATAAAVSILPESRDHAARGLDLVGAALATVGLFCLVFPLTEGRSRGWPPWIFAMIIASVALLSWFWIYERKKTVRGESPLIYTTLFRDPTFRRGMLLAVVFVAGLPSFFFTLTLWLQIGNGFSPLHAGLTTFPFAIGTGLSSFLSDRIVRRFGRIAVQAGAVVLSVGIALLVVVALSVEVLSTWHVSWVLLMSGLGMGMVMAPMVNMVLYNVPEREAGSASGVLSTGQQVGGALGVAVIGWVFFARLGFYARGAPPGQAAFAHAFAESLIANIALFVASALLLFMLPSPTPRR